MDPEATALSAQLAGVMLRNTAGAVSDKITAVKTKRRDQETIAELEEIVTGLLSDKAELVRIAQTYQEEMVAQRISQADIEYIAENVVPIFEQLATTAGSGENIQPMIDLLKPLLSVQTVTILQLIGFNFRKAIGEPLTQVLAARIESAMPGNPVRGQSARTPKPR